MKTLDKMCRLGLALNDQFPIDARLVAEALWECSSLSGSPK